VSDRGIDSDFSVFGLISYPLDLIKSKKSSYVEADLMQKLMSLLSWVFQVEPF